LTLKECGYFGRATLRILGQGDIRKP
jgi:hypothetical protein